MKRILAKLTVLIALSSCASDGKNYQAYLDGRGLGQQTAQSFRHCRGYGCTIKQDINLTDKEFKTIEKSFTPPPDTPEKERAAIAGAIGLLEQIAGEKTGTTQDEAGTFRKTGNDQLDCVDESTNTTTYLLILKEKGLLKFHDINAPTSRLPIIHAGHWPHQTAVIREINTEKRFAIDSWFHDNGTDAEIVPLEQWKEGWKPENIGDTWL